MAFKSKEAPPGLEHGVKGSTGTVEEIYSQTSMHVPEEDTEFIGGGWGGWNPEEQSEPASERESEGEGGLGGGIIGVTIISRRK